MKSFLRFAILSFALALSSVVSAQSPNLNPDFCDFYEDFEGNVSPWYLQDDGDATSNIAIGNNGAGNNAIVFTAAVDRGHVIRAYRKLAWPLCTNWKGSGTFHVTQLGTDPDKGIGHCVFGLTTDSLPPTNDLSNVTYNNYSVCFNVSGGSAGMYLVMVVNVNGSLYNTRISDLNVFQTNVSYDYSFERINLTTIKAIVTKTGTTGLDTVVDTLATLPTGVPSAFEWLQISNNPNGLASRIMWGWVDDICISDCSSVNVAEINPTPLVMYPNPASDQLHIEAPTTDGRVYLTTMDGREICSKDIAEETVTMSLTHVPNGVYVVRIEGADGNYWTEKLVVSK